MDDERRPNAARPTPTLRPQARPEAAALAPTVTPEVALGQAPTFAVGSGGAPDARSPGGTMDLPTSDRGAPSPVQQMIGHFVVRYQLGEGGMGVVYAGLDPDLGRPVAIKLVRAEIDHDGYRARLLREAQAMARLEHPNVVRIYEVGNHAGRLFVAMELVDGETLSRWLRAADRGWRDIVAMFDQVGAGLSAVHRAGLVHRDFKPDNVLVDRGGRARVADFGLARLDPQGGASTSPMGPTLTRTGAVMGTPGYMAPEQQVGSLVDARADQYSFCVAMREALVGARAWDGVPKPVRAAVTRGLSYDASERFESVEALLAAVREAVALEPTGGYGVDATGKQHVAGGAIPMPATMVVGGRRGRGWMFAIGGLAMVVAAGVTAYTVVRNADAPAPAGADRVASPPTPTPTATPIPPPTTTQPTAIATAPPTPSPPPPTPVTTPPPRTRVESKPPTPTPTVKADKPPAPTVSVDPTLPAGVTRLPNGDIVTPLSKDKLPAANVQDPGHLGVVRATIFNLGYDGIDAAAMDRDPKAMQAALEAERDAATGTDQLVAKVKLGMVLRRRGDCGSAEPLWREATKALKGDATDGPWQARAFMGLALCALASGDPSDAFALVSRAWVHGDQPEVNVVMAVADYDQGKQRDALGLFTVAEHNSNPRVQEAVKRWLAGTGLTLPP